MDGILQHKDNFAAKQTLQLVQWSIVDYLVNTIFANACAVPQGDDMAWSWGGEHYYEAKIYVTN
jgi:hypothetical protein